MQNNLKARITVELEDELRVLDLVTQDVREEIGAEFDDNYQHYMIEVGSILNFKEWMTISPTKHEVVRIQTIMYTKTQRQISDEPFDIWIIYTVKRLEPVRPLRIREAQ